MPPPRAMYPEQELKMGSATCGPTAIDLCAGCGGMSLGLEKAGFRVLFANEINSDAAATYRHNFPATLMVQKDIRTLQPIYLKRKLRVRSVDVVAAGLPCQGFSLAGKRNPRDPRNRLYLELIRFVKAFRPKIVVVENVRGMLSLGGGVVVKNLRSELARSGYFVHLRTLVASDYGVPQKRERVFIIATSIKIPEQEVFPAKTGKKITVSEAISDLAFLGVNQKSCFYNDNALSDYQASMRKGALDLHNHESSNHSERVQDRFSLVPQGANGRDFLKPLGVSKHTYFRLDPFSTCRTITTLPEDFIHYSHNRIPTVREMARLQSFPDNFVFCGKRTTGGRRRKSECPQYTQVGNAVPPLMAQAVFENVLNLLGKYYNFDISSLNKTKLGPEGPN